VKYSLITRFKTDKKSEKTKKMTVKVGVGKDLPTPSNHCYSKPSAVAFPIQPNLQQEHFVEGPNDSGAETRNAFWLAYPPCKQLPFHLQSLK
jgi:hypothetical protein